MVSFVMSDIGMLLLVIFVIGVAGTLSVMSPSMGSIWER